MNKGLKIAIGIATIGVLGTAGYLIYKAIKDARDGDDDENKPPVEPPAVVQGGDGGMEYAMATLITGKRKYGSLFA